MILSAEVGFGIMIVVELLLYLLVLFGVPLAGITFGLLRKTRTGTIVLAISFLYLVGAFVYFFLQPRGGFWKE